MSSSIKLCIVENLAESPSTPLLLMFGSFSAPLLITFQYPYAPLTEVLRPSLAYFRFLNVTFLITNYLYRLHVTAKTYEWTLITMCTLHASCRHAAGQAKIPPLVWNHTSPIKDVDIFIFQRGNLFFGYNYFENKTSSEKSMSRASR